jgi:glc operon protein GlcG
MHASTLASGPILGVRPSGVLPCLSSDLSAPWNSRLHVAAARVELVQVWLQPGTRSKEADLLMNDLIDARTIGFAAAKRALEAAAREAASLQVPVAIAVADRAGHLVAYGRMDGAPLLSGQIAQDKAYTVAAFGLPTHEWFEMIKDEPALLHGIVKTERLIIFGGGVAIRVDGEIVGAVGISGGSADQDRRVAEAGATAIDSQP